MHGTKNAARFGGVAQSGGWTGGVGYNQAQVTYYTKTHCYIKDRDGGFWEAGKYFCEDLEDGGLEPDGKVVVDKDTPKEEIFDYYLVDADGEAWKTSARGGVNGCVYDATKKARESLGFGTFTQADRTFFNNHSKVDTGGVSRNNVLDVVSGLLIPWGYGISKVWVPKGTPINESHRRFRDLLGCNPVALATSSTTNDEFLAELGWTKEQVEEHIGKFYWEYADIPGTPSVVMHSFSDTGHAGTAAQARGNAGGHADFVGPRDSVPGGWKIAFAIDRIGNLPYDVRLLDDLISPEMHAGYKELDLWKCKFKGKTANEHRNKKGQSKTTTYVGGKKKDQEESTEVQAGKATTTQNGPTNIGIPFTGVSSASKINPGGCPVCGNDVVLGHGVQMTCTVCEFDSNRFTKSSVFQCKEHGDTMYFDHTMPPTKIGYGYSYLCTECAKAANVRNISAYLRMGGVSRALLERKPENNGSNNQ